METLLYDLSNQLLLILFLIAVIAGIVDAIAGGGGLITVPALLLAGIPPFHALGVNRLQAVIGETTSFITFLIHKQLNTHGLLLGIISTALGATLGSYSVSLFSENSLKMLLPVLMLGITTYAVLSRRLKSTTNSKPKITTNHFMTLFGLLIGFYNGFFGPGTGSIWMISFVILLGSTIKQASISTKPLNLIGNIISLLFFIGLGYVDYTLGLIMGVGQIIGSITGSKMVINNGDKIVRPVFISVTILMTVKLIYEMVINPSISETIYSVIFYAN